MSEALPLSARTDDFAAQLQLDELSRLKVPSGQWSYTQAINSATVTTISSFSVAQDEWRMASGSRIRVPYRGLWLISATIGYTAAIATDEYNDVLLNGTTTVMIDRRLPSGEGYVVLSSHIMLSAGDYLELRVYHNTGAARTIIGRLTVSWMGSLAL